MHEPGSAHWERLFAKLDRIIELLELLRDQPHAAPGLPGALPGRAHGNIPAENGHAAASVPDPGSPQDPAPGMATPRGWPQEQPVSAADDGPRPAPELFLVSRGLAVSGTRQRTESEQYLDRCARFIGARFRHLREFWALWKRSVATGKGFQLSLEKHSPQAIGDCVQLANMLASGALIRSYQYHRSVRLLQVSPSVSPTAQAFVSGEWLERFALAVAEPLAARSARPAAVLWRVLASARPGMEAELDLLVGDSRHVVWVECSTGGYQNAVDRTRKLQKLLRLPGQSCIILCTEPPPPESKRYLEAHVPCTICTVESFPSVLEYAMAPFLQPACRQARQ